MADRNPTRASDSFFLLGVGLGRLQAFLLSPSVLALPSLHCEILNSTQKERRVTLAGSGLCPLGLAYSLPGA